MRLICAKASSRMSLLSDDILQASVTEAGESCAHVSILGIANAGKSAFLKLDDSIFLLDIVAKNMTKVYEICPEDGDIERIYPLLMIWPPKFPAHLTGMDDPMESILEPGSHRALSDP